MHAVHKATVMREGQERLVDPGEVVVDDILMVRPGDQIVVDGPMVSDGHLEVDESLLTGESDLIPKRLGDPLYSGSFCVSGSVCYRAEQVGQESVANQITRGARVFRRIYTPLQRGINLIIQVTLLVAIFCEILLVMGSALNHTPLVAGVRMTMVIDGFPFVPKQNAILTLVTEGIPTVALAAWAHPGQFRRLERLHSFLHFVLPAALTLSLAGLGVYLMALVSTTQTANPGTGNLAITPGALAIAQSALTTFAIVCGLLLIPFVVPPTRAWVGGNGLSGDWRPTLLALGLLLGYVFMLAIPPLRGFFELVSLSMSDYTLIGVIAVAWGLILLWIWRSRLLERFLQVHWE